MVAFAKASTFLTTLARLFLMNVGMGDEGIEALSKACANGALRTLQLLNVGENRISDAGVLAFCKACEDTRAEAEADGDAGALQEAAVGGGGGSNQGDDAPGDEGDDWSEDDVEDPEPQLCEECGGGVEDAFYHGTCTCHSGGAATASRSRVRRLPCLQVLDLRDNRFGDAGVVAIAAALDNGALVSLERLYLVVRRMINGVCTGCVARDGEPLSDAARRAIVIAAQKRGHEGRHERVKPITLVDI